jgi:hypothetical protein
MNIKINIMNFYITVYKQGFLEESAKHKILKAL